MAFVTILEEGKNLRRVSSQHTHLTFSSQILSSSLPRHEWARLPEGLWMWAAGGGSYVINNRFVVLVQRSLSAVTNPGALTVLTGLSDSSAEILNPLLLMRELFEEVMIENQNGEILLPQFSRPFQSLDLNILAQSSIEDILKDFQGNFKLRTIQASIVDDVLRSNIHIENSQGISFQLKGILHFGIKTRSLNFMIPVAIELPDNFMQSLRFFDTESIQNENGERVYLDRKVFFFELSTGILFDHQGNVVSETPIMTDHANYFLQTVKERNQL